MNELNDSVNREAPVTAAVSTAPPPGTTEPVRRPSTPAPMGLSGWMGALLDELDDTSLPRS
jgi:hypothetical protein